VGDGDRARGYSITQIHDRFGVPSTDCGMRYSPRAAELGVELQPRHRRRTQDHESGREVVEELALVDRGDGAVALPRP